MRMQTKLLLSFAAVVLLTVLGIYLTVSKSGTSQFPTQANAYENQQVVAAPTGPEATACGGLNGIEITQQAGSTGAIDPAASELSVTELLDGLLSAADQGDIEALAELRRMLNARRLSEVLPIATRRLEVERTDTSTRTIRQQSLRVANLLMLVAPHDSACALSELRRRWSRPAIEDGRLGRWAALDSGSSNQPAWRALDEYDRIEACGVGDVIVHGLSREPFYATALIEHLTALYIEGIPDGEIPDPWLSQIVLSIGSYRTGFNDSAWKVCSTLLRSICDNAAFSVRLRRQAALLCVNAPAGYWELLDRVREGYTFEETSEAFWQYLRSHSISDEELAMLIDVLCQTYGKQPSEFRDFMYSAMERSSGAVSSDRWRAVSSSLLRVALNAESPDQCDMAIRMLYGLNTAWDLPGWSASSRDSMFEGADAKLSDLLSLHRKTTGHADMLPDGSGSFGTGRIISIAFRAGGSVEEQLAAVTEMVVRRDTLAPVEYLAVVNGLGGLRSKIVNAHGVAIAELLKATFSRYDYLRNEGTPPEKRPVSPVDGEPLILVAVGEALLASGLPVLEGDALAQVSALAHIIDEDSRSWSGRKWRFVSERQIERIRVVASEMITKYG